MRERIDTLSPRAVAVILGGLVLVYALAAWLLFVAPKRADAAELGSEISAAEIRLTEARAAASRSGTVGVRVSEVLQLAKAMPSIADQPGLVLEISRLAKKSGVTLTSITPQAVAAGAGGNTVVPVDVAVNGSFFEISKFLQATRTLVTVRRGKLLAVGRLLGIERVELAESVGKGFPNLDAIVTMNAYVYDGPIAPPEVPAAPEEIAPTGSTAAGSTS